MNNGGRAERLRELQKANFAAYDMLLYLDTHCGDRKAFEIFRSLVEKTNRLKKSYEADFGPLTPYSAASQASFNWLDSPWPWENAANAQRSNAGDTQGCPCGERS